MSTDQAIEQEIQAKVLNAPRVTPADIEAEISAEFYFTANDGVTGRAGLNGGYFEEPDCVRHDDNEAETKLRCLTFCVLALRNGFTVTGESACASPANFDADIGRKVARENAIVKIWPLLGFRLRDQLHNIDTGEAQPETTADVEAIGQNFKAKLLNAIGDKATMLLGSFDPGK